jgi:hypothetical protein
MSLFQQVLTCVRDAHANNEHIPWPITEEPNTNKENQVPGFAAGGRVDPKNIDPKPSEAQKEAGNYAKDHVNIHGLELAIENAKGGQRHGVGKDGKQWS